MLPSLCGHSVVIVAGTPAQYRTLTGNTGCDDIPPAAPFRATRHL
jgi:hypothetical protein